MKIISVVGARPNFMKIAPFVQAIIKHNCDNGADTQINHFLVHTGQHYDMRMSASFFDALNIPRPDIDLEIGSGSHAEQVGRTMIAFEKVIKQQKPDWVVVVGDVNATSACSITAKKEHVKLAHIEAGLRSFDMKMPEEINRLVTDRLSDLLFTTDEIASKNLLDEGVPNRKIKLVGNVMIDTLEAHRERASDLELVDLLRNNVIDEKEQAKVLSQKIENYALMTLHRPSNVDEESVLRPIVDFIVDEVANDILVLWAIHPRTKKQLDKFHLLEKVSSSPGIILMKPLGYHELLKLNMSSNFMMTDSGGLQEECCVLGTPCLTLRWNTERPVTLREHGGASVLVGNDVEALRKGYRRVKTLFRLPARPPLWDGKTAERIVHEIVSHTENNESL